VVLFNILILNSKKHLIRLIIVAPLDSVSDFHIHRLLDNIFQAMVLLAGLDDLIALRNIGKINTSYWTIYSRP
jgi:hypothetical protein